MMTTDDAIGAIRVIGDFLDDMGKQGLGDKLREAAAVLCPPTPAPDTGLMPCGCGAKAELCKAVKPNDGTSFVQCTECSLSTAVFMSEERSRDEWNRAMGWEGEG